jgi:deoxyribonuclease V
VIDRDACGPVRLIGGADISSTRFDPARRVHAAIIVLALPDLAPVARAAATCRGGMPYIPGYLGFREIPALLAAWQALSPKPDLLMVDGHGIAHPRGLGIAAHCGVVLDMPCIGVAKAPLIGTIEGVLDAAPGASAPLLWQGRRIGTALRTRRGANPLYVSVGHRVALASAEAWVWRCVVRHRLPEPTRQAHLAANAERRRDRAESGPDSAGPGPAAPDPPPG